MKYGFKAGLLFALAITAAPIAANAYPSAQAPERARTAAPVVEASCYYGGCWHRHPGWDYWRPRYPDYERGPRYGYGDGWGGDYYDHSRYYSHYRWGSYHRYRRPCDPCGYPRPCDACEWDD